MEDVSSKKRKINPESWVKEHGDYLFNYAICRVNSKTDSEDLVQETFLSALKNYKKFKQNSSERTWFTSILKNKIIDYYRKKSSGKIDDTFNILEESFNQNGKWKSEFAPQNWGENPLNALESEEFIIILKDCLSTLPQKIAGVFILKEIDNKNSDFICKEFKITQSNLWVMLHRARAQLRKCLEVNWFIKQ